MKRILLSIQFIIFMIKNIVNIKNSCLIKPKIRHSFSNKKLFQTYIEKRQYLQVLGIGDNDIKKMDRSSLHRAYINQIKKYHSDNVFNEQTARQYQQISKCIIVAYELLRKQLPGYNKKQEDSLFKDQQQVSQRLFKMKFEDIRYEIYRPGNQQMRQKFIKQLQKYQNESNSKKKANSGTSSTYSQSKSSFNSEPQPSGGSSKAAIAGITIFSLLLIPFLTHNQKKSTRDSNEPQKQHKIVEYTEQQLDIIIQNTSKVVNKSYQLFLNQVMKNRPHMLKYPNKQDPDLFTQLCHFSIAEDIHLYQVQSRYFLSKQQHLKLQAQNTAQHIDKFRLTETKPNTLLTLSLQAQRVLQNVYIKVDDILEQVQKTGKYIPPKVFFNYYGYIMVEIRDKPFSNLLNYRNKQYISLFDLYFDYYSPIFFKRDYYNHYLVGFVEEAPLKNHRYFGHVNINKKSIPTKYLDNKEKIVIMKDYANLIGPSGYLIQSEIKTRDLWENWYIKYEKLWKKGCAHQASGEIKYF